MFNLLVALLERMGPFNYYNGWTVQGFSTSDQLLMTLMKLRLNLRDLDLAERFDTSKSTVSNIFNTYIAALHEILFEGVMKTVGIPSQLKCKGSKPKSFEESRTTVFLIIYLHNTDICPQRFFKYVWLL